MYVCCDSIFITFFFTRISSFKNMYQRNRWWRLAENSETTVGVSRIRDRKTAGKRFTYVLCCPLEPVTKLATFAIDEHWTEYFSLYLDWNVICYITVTVITSTCCSLLLWLRERFWLRCLNARDHQLMCSWPLTT